MLNDKLRIVLRILKRFENGNVFGRFNRSMELRRKRGTPCLTSKVGVARDASLHLEENVTTFLA